MEIDKDSESHKVPEFLKDKHLNYLEKLDDTTSKWAIGFFHSENLKLPGAYWCISAISTLGNLNNDRKEEMIEFI